MTISSESWSIPEKRKNFSNPENESRTVVDIRRYPRVTEKQFGKFLVLKVKCFIWNQFPRRIKTAQIHHVTVRNNTNKQTNKQTSKQKH